MHCVVCVFNDKESDSIEATLVINGTSLCFSHASKVIARGDQLQGYAGWMLECDNNDWWSNK